MALTAAIMEKLRDAGSSEDRARIAAEVGGVFAAGELSPRARADAIAILRALLNDVEVVVRHAMSDAVAVSPELPVDIAKALARDVFEVAQPILELSEALSEDDLIEIVNDPLSEALRARFGIRPEVLEPERERRLVSVARRDEVGERLSETLVREGTAEVAAVLLSNSGARVAELTVHRALDRFGAHAGVQSALVDRSSLPVTVVERLLFMVSETLRARLAERHNLSPRVLSSLAVQVRERATLDLLRGDTSGARTARLVAGLLRQGRLTATLVLRALCVGEIRFAEIAMAQLAGFPEDSTRSRLRNGDGLDLKHLYRRAGFSAEAARIVQRAFRTAFDLADGGDPETAGDSAFRRHMIQVLGPLAGVEDVSLREADFGAHDIDYLLTRLSRALD